MFTKNGKLDREIETRCQKANAVSYQLAPLLKHPSISTSTKAKLINAIFLPMLIYQCQTWSLTKDLERKLVTCEMKCLRKAVNKTRRDKIKNEVIRDMAGAKPVLQHIKQQQVKWFGHITHMPINQPALRAYNTKYSGWQAAVPPPPPHPHPHPLPQCLSVQAEETSKSKVRWYKVLNYILILVWVTLIFI